MSNQKVSPDINMNMNNRSVNLVPKKQNYDLCSYLLIILSFMLFLATFPLSLLFSFKIIREYQRAVIFRLGRSGNKAKGPGIFFVLPCIDTTVIVDLRTVTVDIEPQEILTKDSVSITVDAVVYLKVFDPILSVNNVTNAQYSTQLLAATTLRNVLGKKTLQEILQYMNAVIDSIYQQIGSSTDNWGVRVERVEIEDVRLPVQMQRVMASEAEASREAKAKVLAAEGEQQASFALKKASDIISESPIALQLRYLQSLTQISAEKNSTIVLPIPNELLNFLKSNTKSVNYSSFNSANHNSFGHLKNVNTSAKIVKANSNHSITSNNVDNNYNSINELIKSGNGISKNFSMSKSNSINNMNSINKIIGINHSNSKLIKKFSRSFINNKKL